MSNNKDVLDSLVKVMVDALAITDDGAYIAHRPGTGWRIDGEFDLRFVVQAVISAMGPTPQARLEAWEKLTNPPMIMNTMLRPVDEIQHSAVIECCPFCDAHMDEALELTPTAWEVHCDNGNCPVRPTAYGSTEQEVINNWNTRKGVK